MNYNSTPLSGNSTVDALITGQHWGNGLSKEIFISYSIPQGISYWSAFYQGDEPSSWGALDSSESNAFRQALEAWSDIANINFFEVNDGQTYGDIRVAFSQEVSNSGSAGWAYVPGPSEEAGDIWLDSFSGGTYQIGSFGYTTFLHEIGHALGLAHPFELKEGNNSILSGIENTAQYTLMSYSDYEGVGDTFIPSGRSGYSWYPAQASTPMLYDILAMQYLYGQNLSTRTGNDIYTFSSDSVEFKTIWDAAGNDTFDLSNQTLSVEVDLNAGTFSSIGLQETWDDNFGIVTSKALDNIAIAFDVVIENVIGGTGDDVLIGNQADNQLTGGEGDDQLIGGFGSDTAIFQGVLQDYQIFIQGNTLVVSSSEEGVDYLTDIEYLSFQDQTISALLYSAFKPQTPDEVITRPEEGDTNSINYFLLSLSGALNVDASVQYRTIDGTAIAGLDYVYATGEAVIKAGDTHTVIGVEIIADNIAEANENFFLEVSDPQPIGVGFPNDALVLTALRTIVDDDFF